MLLVTSASPQISGFRPNMRQRALFVTSRAACRWNRMLPARENVDSPVAAIRVATEHSAWCASGCLVVVCGCVGWFHMKVFIRNRAMWATGMLGQYLMSGLVSGIWGGTYCSTEVLKSLSHPFIAEINLPGQSGSERRLAPCNEVNFKRARTTSCTPSKCKLLSNGTPIASGDRGVMWARVTCTCHLYSPCAPNAGKVFIKTYTATRASQCPRITLHFVQCSGIN